MIYVIGLCILLLASILINDNHRRAFLIVSGVTLVLIMSLRSDAVGTDSRTYYKLFLIAINGGPTALDDKAPLFRYLLKSVAIIFGSSKFTYFATTALLAVVPMWIAIFLSQVNCKYAVLLYYLLFFLTSLNITRTYISIAFVVLAYELAKRKSITRIVLAILALTIAFFIHKIAIIGVAIVALSFLNLEKKRTRRSVMAVVIAMCLSLGLLFNLFIARFNMYASTIANVHDKVGASALVYQVIMIASLTQAIYLLKRERNGNADISPNDFNHIMMLIFTEVMLFLAGGTKWYVQRVLEYLEVFVIFIVPVMDSIPNKFRKIYRTTVFATAGILFAYKILRNLGNVMPYTFFWQ